MCAIMAESPTIRFHICLMIDGEIPSLCGVLNPKYSINGAYPVNDNPEFICSECLKTYQEVSR